MQDAVQCLLQANDAARSARKKGDALRRAGRDQSEVLAAFRVGVQALEQGLDDVKAERARIDPPEDAGTSKVDRADEPLAHEMVEALGALGGLNQRMGQADEALRCYAAGARMERRFGMDSTYNRMNEVRQTLLLRADSTLQHWEPHLRALADQLRAALLEDDELSNRGWAWADLGDCLALLGETEQSADAYGRFVEKAEIKSPERTLDVLRLIAARLRERNDAGAHRVEAAVAALQTRLQVR